MATGEQTRAALAYARRAGYTEGQEYSPFDLPGVSFTAHRGHGVVTYRGINNGHLEFRCSGCGDAIFVLPGTSGSEEG
jgi:hypothetical protein